MDPFTAFAGALSAAGVRYPVIHVWGANYYAPSGHAMFMTLDRDLFLPADPDNLLEAWRVRETNGFRLFVGSEPLDTPHDGALTRASDGVATDVELSLVMSSFEFKEVWPTRRMFEVEGVAIPVARLSHIVESKARAGREKNQLFLATHREALQHLLSGEDL